MQTKLDPLIFGGFVMVLFVVPFLLAGYYTTLLVLKIPLYLLAMAMGVTFLVLICSEMFRSKPRSKRKSGLCDCIYCGKKTYYNLLTHNSCLDCHERMLQKCTKAY